MVLHRHSDGKIDMITIIHSGYGAEMFQADQFGRRPESRIWSHKWQMSPAYRYALYSICAPPCHNEGGFLEVKLFAVF
jgi:hypothetical protein